MSGQPSRPPKRRRRDRAETDALVLETVREMLCRDGALAGFTLQNVADEAGVNRVQLYQNFGSKQALLRAAISDLFQQTAESRAAHRYLPFKERRRWMFEQFLATPDLVRLEALLAQDGDQDFSVFPEFDLTVENLKTDMDNGALPPDADPVALHVLTAATYMGYCIFKEAFSRDTGVARDDLDMRVLNAFSDLLNRLTATPDGATGDAARQGSAEQS
ncbi:TetR/AcrR family transcriptional regulator [Streptomyces hirsutus]|uniref:TetR/AcrR family transcriptional regulator n=1 Tax=Streptomyces hirsutus TaxID=35620 RepID=UPI0036624A92